MTPPDRTGGAGSEVVAASTAGTVPGPPVPESTAGAVDPHLAAPAVPELTAGAVAPETSAAPAVSHGWAAALTGEKAHWVPEGAPRKEHDGRPTGLTLEGWYALIDERGLREGAALPPCRTCCRELARMSAPVEPTQP